MLVNKNRFYSICAMLLQLVHLSDGRFSKLYFYPTLFCAWRVETSVQKDKAEIHCAKVGAVI